MKKQEKVEKFVIAPSTHLFLGITVDEKTDIEDEVVLDKSKIHQTIKDLKLTTNIEKEYSESGIKTVEKSTLVQELTKGMYLIWGEDTGYIISPYKMKKVSEAIEDLESIKDV